MTRYVATAVAIAILSVPCVTGSPSSTICPDQTGSSPAIAFSVGVWPAPL